MKDRHCLCSGIRPSGLGERDMLRQNDVPAETGERWPFGPLLELPSSVRGSDFCTEVRDEPDSGGDFGVKGASPLCRRRLISPLGLRLRVRARRSSSSSELGTSEMAEEALARRDAERVLEGKYEPDSPVSDGVGDGEMIRGVPGT